VGQGHGGIIGNWNFFFGCKFIYLVQEQMEHMDDMHPVDGLVAAGVVVSPAG
jgi:hypothetical protein